MHIIKKFNRFELKYILTLKDSISLKKDILKYALPDPNAWYKGKYILTSLYYDSPDHRFYWEKIDGIRYRRKFRIRWYETKERLKDDSIVFLEIKQRIDRITQKKRIPLKYKDALLFCNEGIMPNYKPEDKEIIEEMYSLIKLFDLKPTVITSYERQAFVGTDYDKGLRITYDSHVTYRHKNLDLDAGTYDGFIVPPNFVIMEIKTNERVPHWITELIAKNELKLIRVSKYCQGLDNSSIINNLTK
jgi:SPX domain protein involved in polyphosphate accumulation